MGGVPKGTAVLQELRGISTYMNRFMLVADEEPDVELVGTLDALRSRGRSFGSCLTQACFDPYSRTSLCFLETRGKKRKGRQPTQIPRVTSLSQAMRGHRARAC